MAQGQMVPQGAGNRAVAGGPPSGSQGALRRRPSEFLLVWEANNGATPSGCVAGPCCMWWLAFAARSMHPSAWDSLCQSKSERERQGPGSCMQLQCWTSATLPCCK